MVYVGFSTHVHTILMHMASYVHTYPNNEHRADILYVRTYIRTYMHVVFTVKSNLIVKNTHTLLQ